jgi:tetratricopeptide (TPR) repeat protein
LQHRLPALEAGPRDVPERHRTLRAAIGWSYDLLDVEAQRLFARLGLLAGGGSFEAAQALLGHSVPFQTLEALVEASLVRTEETDGETRITLLETIREFALERLRDADALPEAQERHADYFLSLAECAARELRESHSKVWLDRLTRDLDNLRAALSWSARQQPLWLLRFAQALSRFWEIRGLLIEGRHWLAQAIDRLPEDDPDLRAGVLDAAAALAWRQGDYPYARDTYLLALELYERLGDDGGVSRVLRGLGSVTGEQGDVRASRAQLERSLAIERAMGNLRGVGASALSLGLLEAYQGNRERARDLYGECLATAREVGDSILLGNVLLNLGLLHEYDGDLAQAWSLMQDGLTAFRSIDYKTGVGLVLLNLGNSAADQGDLVTAQAYYQESLDIHRQLGDLATTSYPLFGFGKIALRRADYLAARRFFNESLKIRHETGELRPIARNLSGLAEIDRAEGRPGRAARLFGAAEALRGSLGMPINAMYAPTYEREVAALRLALGEAALATEWAIGRALTLDQAVSLALSEPQPIR